MCATPRGAEHTAGLLDVDRKGCEACRWLMGGMPSREAGRDTVTRCKAVRGSGAGSGDGENEWRSAAIKRESALGRLLVSGENGLEAWCVQMKGNGERDWSCFCERNGFDREERARTLGHPPLLATLRRRHLARKVGSLLSLFAPRTANSADYCASHDCRYSGRQAVQSVASYFLVRQRRMLSRR